MASVTDVVAAIRAVPGAHRDRGTLFEELTAEHLRRDPVFAQRFSEVWLWSDWPPRPAGAPRSASDTPAADQQTQQLRSGAAWDGEGAVP